MIRHQHVLGDVDEQLRLLEALDVKPFTRTDLNDRLLGEGSHSLLHDENGTLHLLFVHPLDVAVRGGRGGGRTSGQESRWDTTTLSCDPAHCLIGLTPTFGSCGQKT